MATESSDREREREALKLALTEANDRRLTPGQKSEVTWLKQKWFAETAKSVPKKLYVEMCGRQHTILLRQARSYRLPLDNETVNLYDLLSAFHDFLAEHGRTVLKSKDALDAKAAADARLMEIKIRKMELDLQERMDQLIDRTLVSEKLSWLASQFAAMAEEVGRNHGAGAQDAINGFLEIMSREMREGKLAT